MDAAQVSELLIGGWDHNGYEIESWCDWAGEISSPAEVPHLGTVHVVENFGGEGQGDSMYLVFRIHRLTEDEEWLRYFRLDGYYSSYGGSDWDGDLYEVSPVQRMVTFYEKAE